MFQTNKTPQEIPYTYVETDYANVGFCCKLDGSGSFTSGKTKRECFNMGGYWTTNTDDCPRQVKKNCCSYSGGVPTLHTNITKCACAALATRTKWGPEQGVPSTATLSSDCPTSLVGDIPGACCHWYLDGQNYINACTKTDSIEDCSALHDGKSAGLKYAFYPGQDCIINGGNIVCNPTMKETDNLKATGCIDDTDAECSSLENALGNCCEQLADNNIACSITTKSKCNGYWNYFGYLKSCTTSSICSGVYFHETVDGIAYPPTASYTTLSTSTNILEKLPSTNEMYQGGIYAGIFEPGVSVVLGNANTGKAQTYKSVKNKFGGSEKRWILIVAPEDIIVDTLRIYNTNTSNYDGFYNMKNLPIENITGLNINGFKDWYIPSKLELEFIFKNIPKNLITNGYTPLNENYYLTSTFFEVPLRQDKLMYAQLNYPAKYGDTFLTSEIKNSKQIKLRLVRRIYLGT